MTPSVRLVGRVIGGVTSRPDSATTASFAHRSRLAAALAVGLVLTACSSQPQHEPFTPDPQSAKSPIQQFFDGVLGMGASPGEVAALEAATEEVIARCMSEQGFEYWPEVPGTTPGDADPPVDYGIGASYDPNAGRSTNDTYYDELKPDGQAAYSTAYWGENGEDGCYGKALVETGADTSGADEIIGSADFNALRSEIESLSERSNIHFGSERLDLRLVEINNAWSECMVAGGNGEFERPAEVQAYLSDEYERGTQDGPLRATVLDELKEQERALFAADTQCQEDVDYQTRAVEVRASIELEFIRTNEADLTRLRDALELAVGEASS